MNKTIKLVRFACMAAAALAAAFAIIMAISRSWYLMLGDIVFVVIFLWFIHALAGYYEEK